MDANVNLNDFIIELFHFIHKICAPMYYKELRQLEDKAKNFGIYI